MDLCCFPECFSSNAYMHMVTHDKFGAHWFCEGHWKIVSFIFKAVAECHRSKKGCIRNHRAEFYPDDRVINTIKFSGKYWNLCPKHLGIYDETTGMDIDLDDLD